MRIVPGKRGRRVARRRKQRAAPLAVLLIVAGLILAQRLSGCPAPWQIAQPNLSTSAGSSGRTFFLDRPASADFRLMTYNVCWDSVFPSKDATRAERFQRIIRAVAPDVLALQEIRQFDASETAALLDEISPRPAGERWHACRGKAGVIASRFPLMWAFTRLDPPTYRDPVIALIDLPDNRCALDLCVINNHFKCCGGPSNDPIRQQQADGVMNWLRDARMPGGEVDVPEHTAFVFAGDLNLVGEPQPLLTLLTGDIFDEALFGTDFAPDWDGTDLTDAHPWHNGCGPDDYTWRNDDSAFDPSRLDYVLYSDSVLEAVNQFVLNTLLMSEADLADSGLERFDCCHDAHGRELDHLPVVVDLRIRGR
ncbi:MAG: endonuclease/exonuclease/phosphatase family protein [Phycisphaerae bacterium]|nr:endonuclease/exonuclease/phosphatase family protein [Phycisphaerae bacterium]